MNPSRRVVFDTGTLVGAALRPSSLADRALATAFGSGVVCVCEPLLERLRSVLARSKWDRYMAKRARLGFVEMLRGAGWNCLVEAPDSAAVRHSAHDRRNSIILALAAIAEADAIISTVPELLSRKTWRRVPIVTPAEFLSWYDSAPLRRS
ncbi:MAG: PIN domain-containing protein [Terracidiphilus sp.]